MDAGHFDALSRSLSIVGSRRDALAGVLAGALALMNGQQAAAVKSVKQCKKIDDKKKRQKCLKKAKRNTANGTLPPPPPSSLPRTATVSGSGPGVTESFPLAAGRYLISATHTEARPNGGNFIVHLWGPNEYEGFIFNELPFDPGTYQYQDVEELPDDGSYFFEVEFAGGPWSISVGPI
jgi:hypothetical protein